MKKAINYKLNIDNPDSFIVYKLCIMPESVLGKKYQDCSYGYLMMNNELIKLLETKLLSREMYNNISIDMLIYIKNIVNESINFYYCFNERAQSFSKKFKNKKIKHGQINLRRKKYDDNLYFAKYICYQEAYNLELPIDKIRNFDIERAKKVLNMINSLITPGFNQKLASNLKIDIIKSLNKDIKLNSISTTLKEIGIYNVTYNPYYFTSLICQQEILDCIKILFLQNKFSDDSLDLCINILNYSIDAANGTISLNLKYLLNKNDINSFNKEDAIKLRNDIICEKYKRISATQKELRLK